MRKREVLIDRFANFCECLLYLYFDSGTWLFFLLKCKSFKLLLPLEFSREFGSLKFHFAYKNWVPGVTRTFFFFQNEKFDFTFDYFSNVSPDEIFILITSPLWIFLAKSFCAEKKVHEQLWNWCGSSVFHPSSTTYCCLVAFLLNSFLFGHLSQGQSTHSTSYKD